MMVIEYAVADGKTSMRYVERVALDWADHGIDNIAAAEAHLCGQERLRQSWEQVRLLRSCPNRVQRRKSHGGPLDSGLANEG